LTTASTVTVRPAAPVTLTGTRVVPSGARAESIATVARTRAATRPSPGVTFTQGWDGAITRRLQVLPIGVSFAEGAGASIETFRYISQVGVNVTTGDAPVNRPEHRKLHYAVPRPGIENFRPHGSRIPVPNFLDQH
jgi:hypothetical protein